MIENFSQWFFFRNCRTSSSAPTFVARRCCPRGRISPPEMDHDGCSIVFDCPLRPPKLVPFFFVFSALGTDLDSHSQLLPLQESLIELFFYHAVRRRLYQEVFFLPTFLKLRLGNVASRFLQLCTRLSPKPPPLSRSPYSSIFLILDKKPWSPLYVYVYRTV